MSDYDDDEARLNLRDVAEALKGEDKAAFQALLLKALNEIDSDSNGLVTELREQVADLKAELHRDRKAHASMSKAFTEASALVESQRQLIADLRLALGTTEGERAAQTVAENQRLTERVEIQRKLIARLQGVSTPDNSPWQVFKAGLSSAFVNPLTAIAGLNG